MPLPSSSPTPRGLSATPTPEGLLVDEGHVLEAARILHEDRLVEERALAPEERQSRLHGMSRVGRRRVGVPREEHVGAAEVRGEVGAEAHALRRAAAVVHLRGEDGLRLDPRHIGVGRKGERGLGDHGEVELPVSAPGDRRGRRSRGAVWSCRGR